MPKYEYKVVPAPTKGTKAKGVKTVEGRFALSVQGTLNQMGADGWEYLRAELLPSDERSGLTGSTTNWRNVLVFRRVADDDIDELRPKLLLMPDEPTLHDDPPLTAGAGQMLKDNGVEETSDVAGMTTSLLARAEQQQDEADDQQDDSEAEEDAKKD